MHLSDYLWPLVIGLCFRRATCQVDGNATCGCEDGTFDMNGTCYFVNENMLSYTNADEHCQRLGGNLVKFEPSENVAAFLNTISSGLSDLWIGLDDKDEEGLFRWIADGSELNSNMSNFRSENEENLDCIGMNSAGDFQFLDCKSSHAAVCDLRVCSRPGNGSCDCYNSVTERNSIDNYRGERCILSLQRSSNSFTKQEETCANLGKSLNNGLNGSLAMFHPWYEVKNIVTKQIQIFGEGKYFWIGLSDTEVEGHIKFRHGDLLMFNDTDTDFNAVNTDAVDCVSVNSKSGKWGCEVCTKTLPFICQTEPNCEGIDGSQTPLYTDVPESFQMPTEDLPDSHVVMVTIVTGVIGSSLAVLVVIVVVCVILKFSKASLQRFRRYKMSATHDTPYTEVPLSDGIEPSNSIINRPQSHPRLSFLECNDGIKSENEHFYDESESFDDSQPGRVKDAHSPYNAGDSLKYEEVELSTDSHLELTENNSSGKDLKTDDQSDVKHNERRMPRKKRSSKTPLLKGDALLRDSGNFAEGGLTNLSECYHEIDSNIYHEVHERQTDSYDDVHVGGYEVHVVQSTQDDSYDDVSVKDGKVDTPEMKNNEFYDECATADDLTLNMVYNDAYDHGNLEGNTATDYDEI